jgi:hypothetical protein
MIASPQSGLSSTISVVHPEKFSTETSQTSEPIRMSAISSMHGIICSIPRPGSHFVGFAIRSVPDPIVINLSRIIFGK